MALHIWAVYAEDGMSRAYGDEEGMKCGRAGGRGHRGGGRDDQSDVHPAWAEYWHANRCPWVLGVGGQMSRPHYPTITKYQQHNVKIKFQT